MSFANEGLRTLPNNAALAAGTRVVVSGGYLAAAGINQQDIGVMEFTTLAGDKSGTVRLRSTDGTHKVIAAAAIIQGALVYTAASGKVSSTAASTSYLRGIAMEAAGANNDIIEVLPAWGDTAIP